MAEASKSYGSTGVDAGRAVAGDGNGDVIVAGFFSGAVDFGGGNRASAGGEDIFVAKFSGMDGSHIWSNRYGSTLDDEGAAIAVGSDHVVVTGFFQGMVDFGGGNLPFAGVIDIFVAKFLANGSHVWSKSFGSTGDDEGRALALDGSGNVVVTGTFSNTVDFGGGGLTALGNDIFVLKLSGTDGGHVWSKRFGNIFFDGGTGVAVDGSGNVTVTGSFAGSVDFGGGNLASVGGDDIFLLKLSDTTVSVQLKRRNQITSQ